MSFIVKGVLERNAEKHTGGVENEAILVLRIDAGPYHHVEVQRRMGQNHQGCVDLARTLRKGQPAEATGGGFALRTDHGDAVFVLRGAHRIDVNGRELL